MTSETNRTLSVAIRMATRDRNHYERAILDIAHDLDVATAERAALRAATEAADRFLARAMAERDALRARLAEAVKALECVTATVSAWKAVAVVAKGEGRSIGRNATETLATGGDEQLATARAVLAREGGAA
jgi:hypothetical protein